jgi:penicillin-binding protein 2
MGRHDESLRRGVFTRRALLLAGAELAVFGGLAVKLYRVQMIEGGKYTSLAEKNRISARLTTPVRGRILDRSGVAVATNKPNWSAEIVAEETDDIAATLDAFSQIVPIDDRDRARILRDIKRQKRFVPVLVHDFLSWEQMAAIQVHAPDLPGIVVDVGQTRQYPFGAELAHVVGYVAPPGDRDMNGDPVLALPGMRIGRAGIELYRDSALRGQAGEVQLEVNAGGRVIRELNRQEGAPGEDVTLALDSGLQGDVLKVLGDESASAVVLDAETGAVLAMSSNPSFDPTLFDQGVTEAQWVAWTSDRKAPLINKAVAGLYAPGSTFKPTVALAGLHAGAITPEDTIFCPGYLDLGDTRFHCWKLGGHGHLDVVGGLKNSCDVFFYETARRVGMDKIAAMANRLGLGMEPTIDLPGARKGLVPTRAWREAHGKPWNIGDTIVAGIGQGFFQLTPLQLATMVARVATGKGIEPRMKLADAEASQPDGLEISERDLALVRQGMWEVVNDPTGTAPLAKLNFPGVEMAGKTGSTQVRRISRQLRESGTFNSMSLPWEFRPHALFICYAPFDKPRYACAVVVEHGNAGAAAAAPMARDIMTATLTRDPLGALKGLVSPTAKT